MIAASEPPVYRPFALLALAVALLGGIPSLAAGILLRSAEVLVGLGWTSLASWIPLSGVLVWLAVACAAANLIASIGARARGVA